MNTFRPLWAMASFFSALYLLFLFFVRESQALYLFLAIALLIFAYWITPYAYRRERCSYNASIVESITYLPIDWLFKILTFPIRWLLHVLD